MGCWLDKSFTSIEAEVISDDNNADADAEDVSDDGIDPVKDAEDAGGGTLRLKKV